MIHYHGTPITPHAEFERLGGRSFCVSFADPRQAKAAHEIGEGVMLDNGAFSFWRTGKEVDWDRFYIWVEPWLAWQTTWAVIPDVIDGTEEENDALIEEWPFDDRGAPVWHLHEPIERLQRLCEEWPRVCFGSSAQYAEVGKLPWHKRMHDAFDAIADELGNVTTWMHMLRGLRLAGSGYPFASADSTNVARNFKGSRRDGPGSDIVEMVNRIDRLQCPGRWEPFVSFPPPKPNPWATRISRHRNPFTAKARG